MKEKLQKINDFEWLLPKSVRNDMNVDAKIFGNAKILELLEDEAIEQLANVASMPNVLEPVIGLADMHFGYGLPMGAVCAFDVDNGIISSGMCGFDINCGVNSIRTNLTHDEVKDKMPELIDELFKNIPCGVGAKGKLKLDISQLNEVLKRGVNWAVENGYGTKEDIANMEELGCMTGADPGKVSDLAKKRGLSQLGTLGAGNHFLEIQRVDEIYDEESAKNMGITKKDQILIMLHCGSRGLGHQVATDYLQVHEKAVEKYKIKIPDKQLVCAPFNSPEGQDYFKAMKCAVNYSFTNRLVMTQWIRESFQNVFKKTWQEMDMKTVYGLCHNVVKLEEHEINGEKIKTIVHRKGATRAFPGVPVLIAGSMGTSSYILEGTEEAMKKTFGSSVHGAGRVMSRHQAIKARKGQEVQKEMEAHGRVVRATNPKVLAEEADTAYKPVDEVIESVVGAKISKKVVKLIPLGVCKG
ncbi:MAG: RtcB family protein [Nanoarchaeota archaeon]|nr:RtcB family protein [Nanoarchaeota archaeon]MBU4456493.1 RtcB family protein [Nanoarchaeota archaeon]